jgi:hypothetical protein
MTDELLDQMAAFDRVVRDRDVDLAAAVLDPDYALVLVAPVPAVVPRATWLATLPDYLVHEYAVEEQTVDVDPAAGCASVLSRVRMRATVLGADRSGVFVLTDVWLRRPDGWRVWRRHSTPATAGAMPVPPE